MTKLLIKLKTLLTDYNLLFRLRFLFFAQTSVLPSLVCDSLPEYRIRIALIPAILRVSTFIPNRSGADFSMTVSESETGIPRDIDGKRWT